MADILKMSVIWFSCRSSIIKSKAKKIHSIIVHWDKFHTLQIKCIQWICITEFIPSVSISIHEINFVIQY